MKIIEINSGKHGSTGNIMIQIADLARNTGFEVYTFSGPKTNRSVVKGHTILGNKVGFLLHRILASVTGFSECFSFFSTYMFLKKLKKIDPDIIHLHNLHGWYINLPLLFKYIKRNKIRVIWTLHDCWAFTGHCPHFDLIGCNKWQGGCYDCPQYKEYPASFFDNSKIMYKLKKKWFTDVDNLTIVTPSQWLADLVKNSFLGCYDVKVINNGINLDVFKPTHSSFKKNHNCVDKFVVLGVASVWRDKKGLDVFVELAKRLDERFQIVLVGTDDNVDNKLPDNIISIHRTQNQTELAEIYTAADLFVNPTREDTYPTVNMESIACGTPVLTFNTGGAQEILNETCGSVVTNGDENSLYNEINRIYKEPYSDAACLNRAKTFNANDRFKEYIELYEK